MLVTYLIYEKNFINESYGNGVRYYIIFFLPLTNRKTLRVRKIFGVKRNDPMFR